MAVLTSEKAFVKYRGHGIYIQAFIELKVGQQLHGGGAVRETGCNKITDKEETWWWTITTNVTKLICKINS